MWRTAVHTPFLLSSNCVYFYVTGAIIRGMNYLSSELITEFWYLKLHASQSPDTYRSCRFKADLDKSSSSCSNYCLSECWGLLCVHYLLTPFILFNRRLICQRVWQDRSVICLSETSFLLQLSAILFVNSIPSVLIGSRGSIIHIITTSIYCSSQRPVSEAYQAMLVSLCLNYVIEETYINFNL